MTSSTAAPRSLTQMFREWDDLALCRLLSERPDLAAPTPTDFSQVASRATTRHSVAAALDTLTSFELWVASAACSTEGPFSASDLDRPDVDPDELRHAVERLLHLGLLWGIESALRPVRAMPVLLGEVDVDVAPASSPPAVGETSLAPDAVDQVAAGSAFEFVRRMDLLVEHCDHQPAKLIRKTSALATRDVRTFATLLDVPSPVAATHLEIARAFGLLGATARDSDEALIPTRRFDDWRTWTLARQWRALAHTWLVDHPSSGPRSFKMLCLQAFGEAGSGTLVTVAELRTWLAWQRPRRSGARDRHAALVVDEAAWLGVTGRGALASFSTHLEDLQDDRPQDTLTSLLPDRVDHVLVQADLTAVAPGPLSPQLARTIGSLADVESRGGASVYRFTRESLERAFRLGWSSHEMFTALQHVSTTPIPQPLEYLIYDLDRLAATRGENPRPDHHALPDRALPRPDAGPPPRPSGADELDVRAAADIIRTLRHGSGEVGPAQDAAARPDGARTESALDTLREAVESGDVVWVGYVDTRGDSGERRVHAQALDDGLLRAHDARTSELLMLPLRRITAAHILPPASSP